MTDEITRARMVWFGMLNSILVLIAVAALTPPVDEDPGPIGIVLPAFGVLLTLSQPMIGRLLAPGTAYFQWLVIRWAFAEATAIMGFVPTLLGGSYAVLGLLAFLALATMGLLLPSEGSYDRWRALRGESEP